jgi:hypothetical protein
MEPEWMQAIAGSTVCNWFYIFYVVNLIVFVILVIGMVFLAFRTKKGLTLPNIFFGLISSVVACTNTLFFYIMCERSLKP